MTEILQQFISSPTGPGLVGIATLSAVFFLGSLSFVPRHPVCMVGGLTFGLSAIPIALLATTAGAVLAFLLSRYFFRSQFVRLSDHRPLWRATLSAIDREGWRLVGLLRLASPIPGTAANYLFGLTGIRVIPYAVATCIGIFPSVVLFVYLGTVARVSLDASTSWVQASLTVAGLVVFALATGLIIRQARVVLAEHRIGS
jgi:uncharacterized membrane protein YdjX (TVP38/TMEM64 family)